MMKKSLFAACVLSMVCLGNTFAQDGAIGHLFEGKSPVKVYIIGVKNESGQGQISADAFKKSIEDSLNNRKSTDFDIINNQAESDIQISAVIKRYQYLERGPFNPTPGIATTLIDAAATATQNYVEMVVDYTVIDTKNNQIIWTDEIDEYIKQIMTPEESIALIYAKASRTFIWKFFGGSHKKETVKGPM